MVEHGRVGRPRSEQARTAVLRAVDDLLVDVGYAAMTMKGIAESAGVSRQTVYRWWSTKAEILLEASVTDAEDELRPGSGAGDPVDDLATYLERLARFLGHSPAGLAYRALLGEAQHDPTVASLLRSTDVLGGGARAAVVQALPHLDGATGLDAVAARLVGPVFFWVVTGRDPAELRLREQAEAFVREAGTAAATVTDA